MNFDQRRLVTIVLFVAIPVLFLLLPPTQPIMFATLALFSHAVLWLFDCAFGAEAFGLPPAITWALVGGVIGACLGYWRIAPAIGRRRMRRVAGAIPLTLLACLFLGDVIFSLANSPKLPPLKPPTIPIVSTSPATGQPATTNNNQPNTITNMIRNATKPLQEPRPKEDVLSTAPEGGGGNPNDHQESIPDTPNGTTGTTGEPTNGQAAPDTSKPADNNTNPMTHH